MKSYLTALSLAAALGTGITAAPAFAGSDAMSCMAGCNSEYAACLQDGTNMSMAMSVDEAIAQGQSNMDNAAACNNAVAACYQSCS